MGLIANELVTQVLERSDIVELISGYVVLKRAGRNFKALCPFHHEKSSSFVVSPDKQIFHCFGCGAGGNAIGFVMKQEKLEFPEAVRFLSEKVGVVIPDESTARGPSAAWKDEVRKLNALAVDYFHSNLLTRTEPAIKKARDYLKDRGVLLEDVKQFKLGFALDEWGGLLNYLKANNVDLKSIERSGLVIARENKEGYYDRFRDRIVFPIFDVKSQCVGFGARTMKDEKGAKYINSPDTPVYTKGHHLFGLQLTRHGIVKKDLAIIVEGYMDMIIPYQFGVDNIVASLGTALTNEQIRLLHRYTDNIVMLFDADAAGQAAMVRSLDVLIEQGMNVKVASLDAGEDPDTFVRKFGIEQFQKRIQEAKSLFDFKLEWLAKQFDPKNIEQRAQICKQMMATIYKIPNAIIRHGYLRQLAERLQVPEEILLKEGKATESIRFNKEKGESKAVVKPMVNKPLSSVDRQILSLVFNDLSLLTVLKENITPEDCEDRRVAVILEKFYESDLTEEHFSIAGLLNQVDDQEVQKIILDISAQENVAIKDPKRILLDCVGRIKKDRLRNRRQTLSELIRQAEMSGDVAKLEGLKEEFNNLLKKHL